MSKHFTPDGDQYLLSPAAALVMTSDAIRSSETSPAGKERSLRVITQVMEVARKMRFEQAGTLETMLLFGAESARLLALCDALVQHIGGWAVVAIVRRVAASGPEGGA
ncbi:hypothetical protein [Massilia sp. BKSP1R2A-1]|uniref:hypothetical protein n=1 Tax=Massilia sp. BKSP1R2A-1 TaxID=3422595 RepID=UPI003D33C501